LSLHAQSEQKLVDSKDSCHEKLGQVFDHFPKYHMKFVLGDFNVRLEREDILKPTIGIESLHQDSNDNVVRRANFATKKSSAMFPHRNFHKYLDIS
jgi:hypothetical protein